MKLTDEDKVKIGKILFMASLLALGMTFGVLFYATIALGDLLVSLFNQYSGHIMVILAVEFFLMVAGSELQSVFKTRISNRRRNAIRAEYLRCRAEGLKWDPFG